MLRNVTFFHGNIIILRQNISTCEWGSNGNHFSHGRAARNMASEGEGPGVGGTCRRCSFDGEGVGGGGDWGELVLADGDGGQEMIRAGADARVRQWHGHCRRCTSG